MARPRSDLWIPKAPAACVWPHAKLTIPLLALLLRLVAVSLTFHGNANVVSWEDVAIAQNLLSGKGYSIDNVWRTRMLYSFVEDQIQNPITTGHRATTLKPPVFPFVVAILFWTFGLNNFLSIFIVNTILSGATAFF